MGDPDDLAELVESLGYAVIPAQITKVGDGNLGDDRKLRTERWLPPPAGEAGATTFSHPVSTAAKRRRRVRFTAQSL